MSESFSCIKKDCPHKNPNDYNCAYPCIQDGLAIQCVDQWAEDKFYYFDRYLSATKAARTKYAQYGNAVYVDLFAGPAMCRIKETQQELAGGALRAATLKEAPFNQIILNDLSGTNCEALTARIPAAKIYNEDANAIVDEIVSGLELAKYDRYHVVFLDPFNPTNLKFEIVKRLATLKRLDIMINLPVSPVQRFYKNWLKKGGEGLDNFLGTEEWRQVLTDTTEAAFCNALMHLYYRQLISAGFPEQGLGLVDEAGNELLGSSVASIKNSKNRVLYYLVLASKHERGADIWRSVLKTKSDGQKGLF